MQHAGECAEVQRDEDAEEEQEKDVGNPKPQPDCYDGEDGGSEDGPEPELDEPAGALLHEDFR